MLLIVSVSLFGTMTQIHNIMFCFFFDLVQSLLPPVHEEDPFLPYYIAAGAVAGFTLMIMAAVFVNRKKHKQGYIFYPPGMLYIILINV